MSTCLSCTLQDIAASSVQLTHQCREICFSDPAHAYPRKSVTLSQVCFVPNCRLSATLQLSDKQAEIVNDYSMKMLLHGCRFSW